MQYIGLTPADVQEQFEPILREANELQDAIISGGISGRVTSLGLPTVTVSEYIECLSS